MSCWVLCWFLKLRGISMKYKVIYIVECEDEGAADAVWDAASNEAYNNPDVLSLEYVSQECVEES